MKSTAPQLLPRPLQPTALVVGDATLDVLARHHHRLVHGGDTTAEIVYAPGGAGANTAAWLASLGIGTTLVTRVGDDLPGRTVTTALATAGVHTAITVEPTTPTGCVVVLVDTDGQRSMLADRGANRRLQGSDVSPALLSRTRHLHMSGYVLLDPVTGRTGAQILTAARAAGLTTSVDPQAAAFLTAHAREQFLTAITGIDLLLPNATELAALTGTTDPASATSLLDIIGAVAVTDGPHTATWIDRSGRFDTPAPTVTCVDSTGAGDAFNAGLLAAWLQDQPPSQALRCGVTTGSTAVTHVGAQPRNPASATTSLPTGPLEEIDIR
ncbi:carbohydrate kinase family protein [Nocardia niigatensis]